MMTRSRRGFAIRKLLRQAATPSKLAVIIMPLRLEDEIQTDSVESTKEPVERDWKK